MHTEGYLDGDITVQTCWDADRLDLGRVGIVPQPEKLCTEGARDPDLFKWAVRGGEGLFVPPPSFQKSGEFDYDNVSR